MKAKKIIAIALCFAGLMAFAAENEQIHDADLRSYATGRNPIQQLEGLIAGADDAWVGFSVPKIAGKSVHHGNGKCSLEGSSHNVINNDDLVDHSDHLLVLAHAQNGEINKIRFFSNNCPLDAAGATVHWLNNFPTNQAVQWLADTMAGDNETARAAMAALAHVDHEDVDPLLEKAATGAGNKETRQQAIFWLGANRGEAGFQALQNLAETSEDTDTLEHITFGLHLSNINEAKTYLMSMARDHQHAEVRSKALFWVAQEGGDEALNLLRERLAEESSSDALEKIMFSFSQLPDGQGEADLKAAAQDHENPAARAGALFWLVQNKSDGVESMIMDMLAQDSSSEVRERAIFCLSQLPEERAIPALTQLAEHDERGEIRAKALFWLAQKAGERVSQQLEKAVNEDPEMEVKKQAVFAISQLPNKEGIAMLMELAREHKSGEIRKQALFWLGQSGDQRALDAIKEVLD